MDVTITTTRTDAGAAPVTVTTTFHKDVKGAVAVETGLTTRRDSGGSQTTQDTIAWDIGIVG